MRYIDKRVHAAVVHCSSTKRVNAQFRSAPLSAPPAPPGMSAHGPWSMLLNVAVCEYRRYLSIGLEECRGLPVQTLMRESHTECAAPARLSACGGYAYAMRCRLRFKRY
jgi:hypothetical protein